MSTLPQDDKLATVSFRVPEDFKVALDMQVAQRPRTTLEELCVRTLADGLDLELPAKYRKPEEEPKHATRKR